MQLDAFNQNETSVFIPSIQQIRSQMICLNSRRSKL